MSKVKWQHDGIDAVESWWLGPDGCDSDAAIATVDPWWGPTRGHGQGRPDKWVARDAAGARIGEFRTIREAKKAASDRAAQLDREVDQILAKTKG